MERIADWGREVKAHKHLIFISIIFLAIAIILNILAGNYVKKAGTAIAPDLILDNLPAIDLSPIFVYGFILVIAILFLHPLLFNVREFHIITSQFSLLVLIRSFFITLTHLKAPIDAVAVSSTVNSFQTYSALLFNNDLFFSGHTAIPFLGFLIFRKHRLGIFFLIATVILGSTVLLMHLHYSIDVFAAVFIAYGSYKFGNWLFRRIGKSSEPSRIPPSDKN